MSASPRRSFALRRRSAGEACEHSRWARSCAPGWATAPCREQVWRELHQVRCHMYPASYPEDLIPCNGRYSPGGLCSPSQSFIGVDCINGCRIDAYGACRALGDEARTVSRSCCAGSSSQHAGMQSRLRRPTQKPCQRQGTYCLCRSGSRQLRPRWWILGMPAGCTSNSPQTSRPDNIAARRWAVRSSVNPGSPGPS